jgi:hypothetical protein
VEIGNDRAPGMVEERVPSYTPKRATLLAAALLLAAREAKTDTHTWRNPTDEARRYLGQMVEWGYEPSAVEQLILTLPTTTPTDPARSPSPVLTRAGGGCRTPIYASA